MVVVAGSANLDFVVRAPHIPGPGETVLGGEFKTYPGGKGANQAAACARAGGVVTHMLAALGNDAYAVPIEASLADAGVVLHAVRVPDQATGTAFICVSADAENAITVAPGANQGLTPEHLTTTGLPPLASFSHLLMQLETPLATVAAFAHAAHAQGVTVVLNAAPAQALPAALLADLDILIVNEGELAALAGGDGDLDAQLARIAVPTVVVTLGGRGCLARSDQQRLVQPSFPIKPVDTTGAGDAYAAGFLPPWMLGLDLVECLRLASLSAARAVARVGAGPSSVSPGE
jgi:ribokinase